VRQIYILYVRRKLLMPLSIVRHSLTAAIMLVNEPFGNSPRSFEL
jgi:hypothetical protein